MKRIAATDQHRLASPSRSGDAVLCCDGLSFTLRTCPDFKEHDRFEPKTFEERQKLGGFVLSFSLLPYRTGWVHVARLGQVARIERSPLKLGLAGKAATDHVLTAAVDDKTGTLVLINPDNRTAVLFDLERMETVRTVKLDCGEVGSHVRASNGTAWISTRNGVFFRLDIKSGTITGRTILSDEEGDNSVTLDLSSSGKLLAACCSHFVRGGDRPTVLKVFRVDKSQLKEIASAHADLPHSLNAITILEKEEVIVLNSQSPVFAWHYGGENTEHR